jgi:hypothetical protein
MFHIIDLISLIRCLQIRFVTANQPAANVTLLPEFSFDLWPVA